MRTNISKNSHASNQEQRSMDHAYSMDNLSREWSFVAYFKHLPTELKVLLCGVSLWIVGIMSGLPPVPVTFGSATTFKFNIIIPIFSVFLLQLIISYLPIKTRIKKSSKKPFYFIKMLPIAVFTFFLYLNFKSWMPIINPRSFDATYYAIDTTLQPVIDTFINIRMWVANLVNYKDIDAVYFTAFWTMFTFSFIFHGLFDTHQNQRRVFTGLMLNLLLGGLAYSLTPTVGPFIYRQGVNEMSTNAQGQMYGLFSALQTTGVMPKDYLGLALAAMPSLHIAHSLFFTLSAARSLKWLLVFHIPCFLWFFIECVSASWHYLADIPGGIALCMLTWYLLERIFPNHATAPVAAPSEAQKHKKPTRSLVA